MNALGRLLRALSVAALAAMAAATVTVGVLATVPPPTTAFMIAARLDGSTATVRYQWRDASRISEHLLLAVIAAEDQRFPEHWGFDFDAIEKAVAHNEKGGSVRGASTISQQTAKNLFLWPGRSYLRKGLEAALTVLLETLWTKRRILEVYANVAEMGPGIYGAEAAARAYFGKAAADLTREEAALLAAVLPDPKHRRPDRPSPAVVARQRWILGQMHALGGVRYLDGL